MRRPLRVWRGPCRPPGTRWPGRAGVTSTAPLIRPATVSPSPSPTRSRRSAMAGRSPSSWVTGPAPPVETAPSCGASCGRERALILVVPAESVVPQAAVDRPEGWLCRSRPGRGARVMMRPSIRARGTGAGPVSTGPPAPSAGDRPTRAGGGTAAPCAGSCRGRCPSCSTASGPPPGCTTRWGGSRATPWTCPGRQGRAISLTPTWFAHATMMSSRSARARTTVLAAHGTPPDGNFLHPPPSGPMGRQPTPAVALGTKNQACKVSVSL